MNKDLKKIQQTLTGMGFNIGPTGADGIWGEYTADAIGAALRKLSALSPETTPLKPDLMTMRVLNPRHLPRVTMDRIIMHWTAGAYAASDTDKEHYHFLVESVANAPRIVRGLHSIAANVNLSGKNSDHYAAHTLNLNTRSIGISVCCMGGAIEQPFNPGRWPMTLPQYDMLVQAVADLCEAYEIPVTPRTVLSHAEVQGTLGVKQRGKWDYTVLSPFPDLHGATTVGDRIRQDVLAAMRL